MDEWTWRDRVALWLHRWVFKIRPDEAHELIVKDALGVEIFNVGTQGGWVASGPPEPYTLWCRHYDGEDDSVGTLYEL